MAVSEKGRGKGIKIDDSDERRRGVSGKGKKVVLGKGKKVVSDDDDEGSVNLFCFVLCLFLFFCSSLSLLLYICSVFRAFP